MRKYSALILLTAMALGTLSCGLVTNALGIAQRVSGVDVEELADIDPEAIQQELEELEDLDQLEELEDLGQLIDEGLDLSAEFPNYFPMPEAMSIEAAYELDNTINAVLQFDGDAAEAQAAFETSLSESGWSIDSSSVLSTPLGDTITLEISGPDGDGSITIIDFETGAAIEVTLNQ